MVPLRRMRFAWNVMAALLLVPLVASAASRRVVPVPAETPVHRSPANIAAGVCQLGIVGDADLVGDLFPPDDVYYVLMRPTTCGQCSLAALVNVHLTLEFRTPCSIEVSLGVVPAFGTTCLVPDPAHTTFASFNTTLTATETGITEFIVPVPADWKLTTDAFLTVGFPAVTDSCSAGDTQPRIAVRAGCATCTVYENVGGSIEDECPSGAGLPLISAEVGECVVTPALPRSWGAVKTLYR